MQDFVSFWSSMFDIVCDFLLSEPIIWFVGILILVLIAGFIRSILKIGR